MEEQTEECCPRLDPAEWENKEFEWKDKPFLKDNVFTMFFMPINFGQVMTRIMAKAEKLGAKIVDGVCLSDHKSKFKMEVLVALDKEVQDDALVKLSGRFFSKVYEGDFKDTQKWCDDMEKVMQDKGHKITKWYMWYTTCPKCAKKYGKNYVVIFVQY